jgi:hypothetical protein
MTVYICFWRWDTQFISSAVYCARFPRRRVTLTIVMAKIRCLLKLVFYQFR